MNSNQKIEQLDDKVFDFVANFCNVAKETLSLDTDITNDLLLAGDDGEELMLAFAKQFNVDISEFDIGAVFGDEGTPVFVIFLLPLVLLYKLYLHLFNPEKLEDPSLTIGTLIKAVHSKKIRTVSSNKLDKIVVVA